MLHAAIKQTPPAMVAYMGMHGPYEQMPTAYKRLYHWLESHNLDAEGMPSTTYYTIPEQTPEEEAIWELRAQVGQDAIEAEPDENGIGVRHIAPTTVAWAVHKGPYESTSETYFELIEWAVSSGYVVVGPPEEHYLSPPEMPPDRQLTEIRLPVSHA